MKKIVLIGGGGHCKSCIDVIEREGRFKIVGIVDVKGKLHQRVLGYEVIASDGQLSKLVRQYKFFLITIGQIKNAQRRVRLFEYLKNLGARFPAVISPLAYISKHARIGEGTIVMHKTFLNAGSVIGNNCIINTGAIIEHGAFIGDHSHISTRAVINGDCFIGGRTFIGSASVLANNISIAEDVVVGAGSVVVKTISRSGTYTGNPARRRDKDA